ncbi:plasma-membrane proton-efflux P-type ATPase [Boudabousia liubingyangii]|uniref:plasma-membrane proton-efflux P-type ATPase n=1 Tax=Boudabousia liubingyangii TaxID=1921764 RepID=UPI00093E7A3B|nr:plasma-membrane proton-efflux P-type ATPase [Boudabousia liubingyangii]OKL46884.1 plasma-membrane proton-efflux P-type ATPase [Boudabousia liubingyangii]
MSFSQPASDKIDSTPIPQLLETLNATKEGLSASEAAERLKIAGPNALAEKKVSTWKQLLRYFWGPIPWMIEIAAIMSAIAQDYNDFIIITSLLIFNAVIGFWEEHKAANALDALKAGLALTARALRDGKWQEVQAASLVPGDVVRIRLGDVVPADCVLIEGDYISIDQAALTGESLPVSKKVGDVAYSGSVAKQGEMVALVCCTGTNTFFGKTASLVANAESTSHFQQAVLKIGNFLILVALGLCTLLTIVLLHRLVDGPGVTFDSVLSLSKFVLVLAVAAIPVAMPAVLSITMALGALALSKAKAIVSRLQAIEEMAGVDVLCSDKTGTLTQNKLSVDDPVMVPAASEPKDCSLVAALACRAENNDPIDNAVLATVPDQQLLNSYTCNTFVPFDPVSKRTQATITGPDGQVFLTTKGAPQVVIDLCKLPAEEEQRINDKVHELASHGYRTLAVACSAALADTSQSESDSWQFMGILPLSDPPREDSAATIAAAKKYGLRVKMVTGDDTAIAAEISGQLGMGTKIQAAADMFEGVDPDHINADLAERIDKADGFARVFPEHKYGIVKALQSRGHIVAMTGDGVNDAPALKQADAGVAVEGATDAARAAADLVLTAPGLSVVITAIEQARQIFERMLSYTIYRIAMTIDVMLFVVAAIICFPHVSGIAGAFMPLTPVMIILLALLDDIPIMTIAYDNTRISPTPVRWEMPRVLTVSTILGLTAVIQTFGLLVFMVDRSGQSLWGVTVDGPHIQTAMFLQLVVGGHLMLFVTRQAGAFFSKPAPSWKLVSALLGTQLFAALLCGFGSSWLGIPALPWALVGFVWVYNLVWMVIQDGVKLATYRFLDRGRN